jgi:lactoylglutathione lyase
MKNVFCLALVCLLVVCCLQVNAQTEVPHHNHSTIYVVDMNKSAEFYEKALMLKRIPEPFHDNKHIWLSISDHSQLHIVQGAAAIMPHDINIHMAFSVTDLPAFMKHLDELGVKYGNWKGDPKTTQPRPDGVTQIYLQDPDGYWIEINNDKY